MSIRFLFSMMIAMALAFAPFAMPIGEASAAQAGHHESMAKADHCNDIPAPAKSDSHKAKPCCVAGCMAPALLPAMSEGLAIQPSSAERPGLDSFRRGFFAEIATPPPRRA